MFEFEKKLESFKNEITKRSQEILKQAKAKLEIQDLRKEFTNNCNIYQAELESLANKSIRAFNEVQHELESVRKVEEVQKEDIAK